jgi:Holliday junction DNA helicase RuvA
MISYLIGTVTNIAVDKDFVLIEIGTQNVGYEIITTENLFKRVSEYGIGHKIYTYYYFPERASTPKLFGFPDSQTRDFFLLLKTVKKISVSTAMKIVSASSVQEIAQAIKNKSTKQLSDIPGIGPKSAQTIILTIENKVDKFL